MIGRLLAKLEERWARFALERHVKARDASPYWPATIGRYACPCYCLCRARSHAADIQCAACLEAGWIPEPPAR